MHVSLNNHFKLCLQKKRKRKSKSNVGFSANKHVCNLHSYPHYSTSTAIPIPRLRTYHRHAHVPSEQPPSPHTHFDTLQSARNKRGISLPGTRGVYPSCSWQEEQSKQEERDKERGMSPHHVTEWEPLPLPQVQIISQNLHLCISFSCQKVVIPVDLCTLLLWTLLPSVFTPDDTAHKEVYKVVKLPHVLCTSYYSASTAIPIPRLCTVP